MAKESAEEKLLKLMQKSTPSAAAKSSSPSAPKKKFRFTFSIGALNTLLCLGILGCILALGFEVRSGVSLLNKAFVFPVISRTDASLSDISLPSVPGLSHYLSDINERNIFKPYVPKVAEKSEVQGLAQRMSRYRLVGIAWLDLPETATIMIEDPEKNETYFLKQGQQLDGVTVKTIYTDRVVFSHENEETTIKL